MHCGSAWFHVNEIETLYKESIEFINEYITELDSILAANNGFHTEKVSEKIKLLQLMQESADAFEETDISYQEAVQNLGQGET